LQTFVANQPVATMSAPTFPRINEVPGTGSLLATWVAYVKFDSSPDPESMCALKAIAAKKPWQIGTIRLSTESWDTMAIMQKTAGDKVAQHVAQASFQSMLDSARVPAHVDLMEPFVGYHLELIKKISIEVHVSSRYPDCDFSDTDAEEEFHLLVTHGVREFEKHVEEYWKNKKKDALALPSVANPILDGLKPHKIFWINGMPETLQLATQRQLSEKLKRKWVLLKLDKRVTEAPEAFDFQEFSQIYTTISKVSDNSQKRKACCDSFSEHFKEKTGDVLQKPKSLATAVSTESEGFGYCGTFFLTFGGHIHMTPEPLDI